MFSSLSLKTYKNNLNFCISTVCSVLTDSEVPQNLPHRSALVSSLPCERSQILSDIYEKWEGWRRRLEAPLSSSAQFAANCAQDNTLFIHLPNCSKDNNTLFSWKTGPRITPSSPSKQLRSKPFSFSLQFQLTVQFVTLHTGASLEDLFEGILDHAPWKAPTMQTCWASGSYLQTTYHLLRFAKLSL